MIGLRFDILFGGPIKSTWLFFDTTMIGFSKHFVKTTHSAILELDVVLEL